MRKKFIVITLSPNCNRKNLHRFRSIAYAIMAVINFGMTVALCQLYGATGAAVGTAFSLIVANGFIMNIYYYKKCNVDVLLFWENIFCLSRGLVIPVIVGIMYMKLGT